MKFEEPSINVIENVMIEPVYAASGEVPSVPITPIVNTGDWTVTTEWCNHNSGSHSEIKISAHNNGKMSGDNLEMVFIIRDFKLDSLTPGDPGCLIAENVTESGFIIKRVGRHFNPGENIGFVMQLTCKKPDGSVGAVGTTGVYMPCSVVCVSCKAY